MKAGNFPSVSFLKAPGYLRRKFGLPEIRSTADAKLPAAGEIELVSCVQALVVSVEVIEKAGMLCIPQEDEGVARRLWNEAGEDVGNVE